MTECNCLCCNKSCQHKFDKKWNEWFFSAYKITDSDYVPLKRVCKDFEIKNLGEYHDLYVQSYTLLLAGAFENFRNMCFEIHELGPVN